MLAILPKEAILVYNITVCNCLRTSGKDACRMSAQKGEIIMAVSYTHLSEGEAAVAAQPDPKKLSPIPMDITVEPPVENIYHFPPISLLKQPKNSGNLDVSEELKANAAKLVDTLKSFGVQTRIIDICRGPTVTRYELQPSAGVKDVYKRQERK